MPQKVYQKQNSVFSKPSMIDISILMLIWIVTVIIVNPLGDFPLMDDFSFGLSVKNMLEYGTFRPTEWAAMTLFTQTLWGVLFSKLFGFSFTVLRFSTLCLALLGTVGTYLLLRQIKDSRWMAMIAALTLAVNPIYFALSFTFMTDVAFTAFSILSLLFFVHFLKSGSDLSLVLGVGMAIVATLCRQIGLFLPIAFSMACFVRYGISRYSIIRVVLTLFGVVGAMLGFELWRKVNEISLPFLDETIDNALDVLLHPKYMVHVISTKIYIISLYLGLFLFPLLLLSYNPVKLERSRSPLMISVGVAIFFILTISWMSGNLMPLSGNILIKGGIGPVYLHDVEILQLPHFASLPFPFWMMVTAISVTCGIILVTFIIIAISRLISNVFHLTGDINNAIIVLLLTASTIYSIPIMIGWLYDRYLIPLIPIISGLIILLIDSPQSTKRSGSIGSVIIVLFCYLSFSVAVTRDYLEWNRVRWVALNDLVAQERISFAEIDGGFEFNGWYLKTGFLDKSNYSREKNKSWWWVKNNNKYVVAMGPIEGFETVKEYKYSRWLPPQSAGIYVLRRLGR